MSEITIQTAAAHLMAHATPAFAPLLTQPVEGEPGLSRTVRVAIEVDDGIWARALTHGGTKAWRDVLAERGRQILDKGYTPEHDDAHTNGEIAEGALSCVTMATAERWGATFPESTRRLATRLWPWPDGAPDPAKPPRAHLVQAVAMLVAEIERIDRATAQSQPEAQP